MPKKFKGENSKASAARARKEAADKKQKEAEDAYWEDNDKHVKQKQQRKEERERKQKEAADRKQELQMLYEQEMESSKPKAKATAPPKLTRLQIGANRTEIEEAEKKAREEEEEVPVNEQPLEENVNRLIQDDDARTVGDAISLLSTKEEAVDRHPERRMKAAYKAFEEENLPLLKTEYPNMRLSQLKQMLHKDWNKSPQNPLNQARGSS